VIKSVTFFEKKVTPKNFNIFLGIVRGFLCVTFFFLKESNGVSIKRRFTMKKFAVLVAALAFACPAVIPSGIACADEIVVTPGQWDSATAPAAPGNWRHVGTLGDTGEPAPEGQAKKAAPAKEEKGKEAAPAGKETKGTAPAKEKKEAAPLKETKEASPATETKEAPQESKAPEYRIFNLNLPAPPEAAKPQPQPAPAPAPSQPAPAPAPDYIEKGGMIIPSANPGPPGRQVTVTPER
jgi:hypothetical protein